jgi:hypothetical protein
MEFMRRNSFISFGHTVVIVAKLGLEKTAQTANMHR